MKTRFTCNTWASYWFVYGISTEWWLKRLRLHGLSNHTRQHRLSLIFSHITTHNTPIVSSNFVLYRKAIEISIIWTQAAVRSGLYSFLPNGNSFLSSIPNDKGLPRDDNIKISDLLVLCFIDCKAANFLIIGEGTKRALWLGTHILRAFDERRPYPNYLKMESKLCHSSFCS